MNKQEVKEEAEVLEYKNVSMYKCIFLVNKINYIFVKYKKVCNKGCGVLKQDNANEKRNKSLCERFRGSAWMQAQRERKNECEQFSGHP